MDSLIAVTLVAGLLLVVVAAGWHRSDQDMARSAPTGVDQRPEERSRSEPEPSWWWRRTAATMAYVQETYRLLPRPLKLVVWAGAIAVARGLGVRWPFLAAVG